MRLPRVRVPDLRSPAHSEDGLAGAGVARHHEVEVKTVYHTMQASDVWGVIPTQHGGQYLGQIAGVRDAIASALFRKHPEQVAYVRIIRTLLRRAGRCSADNDHRAAALCETMDHSRARGLYGGEPGED